ncbi:NAD(P)/FAD-dependent oxidoreductase [Microlunatus soli]|uniref:Pyridine nucleotide-disulphide oxidoreductase n=1 Tax=Microlunatus soli TaxID=630515 RepID=A0A1H1N3M1_9ACTN|nr:NAD(P)/FAD-dependent oxidoreductase [Microlunatus soli]SDR93584.1 Pyridine nucleotide-disulphide oxidoreductase [Microlunatus soli]
MNMPTTLTRPKDSYDYLIVGGGMVADSAAKAIQQVDPNGAIGIVGSDPDEPVTRPALTKKLWTDPEFTVDQVWLKTVEQTGADLVCGVQVDAIDRAAHQIEAAGRAIGYRRLLLATGGEPKRLDLPDDDRILTFRTFADYQRLRRLAGNRHRIAVVGGGYIGSELAAALVANDTEVEFIHPQKLIYEDSFPSHLARQLTDLYQQKGVSLRSGTMITGGSAGPAGIQLTTDAGDQIDADAAVIGVGITPNTELAEQAGLSVDDGVVVDSYLTTSDPAILAAGDVARYPDRLLGRQRVEHVDNAEQMGRQAGRNLAGAGEPYTYTPYFYSVLFGNRYEAIGTLDPSAELVENWSDDHQQGVVYYRDGRSGVVQGVLLWNVDGRTDDARSVIARSSSGDLAPDDLTTAISTH